MAGSMTERLQALLQEEAAPSGQAMESLRLWTFPLDTISCKIGKRVTTVWHSQLPEAKLCM